MARFSPRLRIQWIRTWKTGLLEADGFHAAFQSSIEDSVDSYTIIIIALLAWLIVTVSVLD